MAKESMTDSIRNKMFQCNADLLTTLKDQTKENHVAHSTIFDLIRPHVDHITCHILSDEVARRGFLLCDLNLSWTSSKHAGGHGIRLGTHIIVPHG